MLSDCCNSKRTKPYNFVPKLPLTKYHTAKSRNCTSFELEPQPKALTVVCFFSHSSHKVNISTPHNDLTTSCRAVDALGCIKSCIRTSRGCSRICRSCFCRQHETTSCSFWSRGNICQRFGMYNRNVMLTICMPLRAWTDEAASMRMIVLGIPMPPLNPRRIKSSQTL